MIWYEEIISRLFVRSSTSMLVHQVELVLFLQGLYDGLVVRLGRAEIIQFIGAISEALIITFSC